MTMERRLVVSRDEYLKELESLLKKYLSQSEIEDILRDYREYFEDGRRQNKTDLEISAKLGSPEIIARQFLEESVGLREADVDIKREALGKFKSIRDKLLKGLSKTKEVLFKVGSAFKRKFIKGERLNSLFERLGNSFGRFIEQLRRFFNRFTGGVKGTMSIWNKFWAFIWGLIILGCLLALQGFLAMAIFGVACGFLFLAGVSLFGLVASFTSIGFLSPFVSMFGIFSSVFVACICGFIALLFVWVIRTDIKLIKNCIYKVVGKNEEKGDSENV